jgi:prokaryotic ubiquitin-like protein Pup
LDGPWLTANGRVPAMEGKMAEQKKKETRPSKPAEGGDGAAASPEIAKKGKKIKEDIDKLLDEIDDILEENAEEFVKSYVQRGGE